MYPELYRMDITFGSSKTQAIGTAYCLGEWADAVRYEGDTANTDDMGMAGIKVMGTMKSNT